MDATGSTRKASAATTLPSGASVGFGVEPGASRTKARGATWMVSGLIWTLLAGSVVAWAWSLVQDASVAPSAAVQAVLMPSDAGQVKHLLGAPANRSTRLATPRPKLVLTGVIGNRQQGHMALLGIENQPPRPFLVGREVLQGYVLKAVDTQQAVLTTPEGDDWTLAMPQVSAAQAGSPATARSTRLVER